MSNQNAPGKKINVASFADLAIHEAEYLRQNTEEAILLKAERMLARERARWGWTFVDE